MQMGIDARGARNDQNVSQSSFPAATGSGAAACAATGFAAGFFAGGIAAAA